MARTDIIKEITGRRGSAIGRERRRRIELTYVVLRADASGGSTVTSSS